MTKKDIKWENYDKGFFLVNTLGIIFSPKDKKILIGKRENDEFVPNLRWSFPGGRPEYNKDMEKALEDSIERKTGLKVKSLGPVFARIPKENNKFLLIYYLCEVIKGKERPMEEFVELKWVGPEELEKHFTTSFDPRLKEYIMNLR